MSTRDRILEAAKDLFQRHGFHAVGVTDILAQAEAPKGCLYHHFPGGKDELGAEAVARIGADVAAFIDARGAAGASGATIVGQIAEMSARRMEAAEFRWSPLIAAVASQAGEDTPRLAAAVVAAYRDWQDRLEKVFSGEGLPLFEAAGAARLAVLALEGAVVLARVERDAAPLRALGGLIERFAAPAHAGNPSFA
ncbi:MAG: TetR/AcrR family transcriptional regulator [Alphaproteobacteria bacterium]|nr:TetR/AcrR family transcriptional regulator [Alphaproteobacteria bacterium]